MSLGLDFVNVVVYCCSVVISKVSVSGLFRIEELNFLFLIHLLSSISLFF